MLELLPHNVGDVVEVNTDSETRYPIAFRYQGKDYEVVRVVYTYFVPESHTPERGRTFFFVRVQGGEALLKREDGAPTDLGTRSVWYMVSAQFKDSGIAASPQQSERTKNQLAMRNAVIAYKLIYGLEGLFRRLVLRRFGQKLEQELESIHLKRKDKSPTLLDELKQRQTDEASHRFDDTSSSLLEYMAWLDWIDLIREKWDQLFPSKPSDKSQGLKRSLLQDLEDLRIPRNAVAHMRGVSDEDVQKLIEAVKVFTNLGD